MFFSIGRFSGISQNTRHRVFYTGLFVKEQALLSFFSVPKAFVTSNFNMIAYSVHYLSARVFRFFRTTFMKATYQKRRGYLNHR